MGDVVANYILRAESFNITVIKGHRRVSLLVATNKDSLFIFSEFKPVPILDMQTQTIMLVPDSTSPNKLKKDVFGVPPLSM